MGVATDLTADPALLNRLRNRRGQWWIAIVESAHVISALVMRESATRYGGSRLGYLWAFIEPLALLAIFLAIKVYIRDRVVFGESALVFVASGFLTVRISLAIARQTMGSITSNRSLMTFPSVAPLDAVLAKLITEMLTMGTVIVLFYVLLVNSSDVATIDDPVKFTTAIAVTFLVAGGVGVFNSAIVIVWKNYSRIFGLLSLPLLISSGVFYLPALMGPTALAILSWNPVLHCVEWFREAIYMDYVSVLDPSYPITFGLIMLGTGLILVRMLGTRVPD